jgi:type IV pilus assembly protein PilE
MLEMLLVVAVVAILAVVAFPSYQEMIRRGNRTDAKAILVETAQFMERFYTTNNTYAVPGPTPLFVVSPKGSTGIGVKYNIDFSVTPTDLVYTLRAVPANSQVGDRCGTLTISNTGAQTAALPDCW